MGCEEHVVRQSGDAPSTPFGTSNVPAQQRSLTASQQRSHQPQLSTDWRGTPRITGGSSQQSVGPPIVPSGSAATPRTKK
jgi:hypothetical protein